MSKKIEYNCNLCRNLIKDPTHGRGVNFTSLRPTGMELTAISQTENHICYSCLDGLRREMKEVPDKD